jgi:hypothetical protein
VSESPRLPPEQFHRALREALARHGLADGFARLREGFRHLHRGEKARRGTARPATWRPLEVPPRLEVLRAHADETVGDPGPDAWAEASEVVLPRLRPTLYHALQPILEELDRDGQPVPHAQLSEHLCTDLVVPLDERLVTVTEAMLDRWEVSFPDALAQAGSNLGQRSGGTFEVLSEGLFASTWEDRLDPARLLFPLLFRELPLEGDPVAVPIAASRLLVTGTESEAGLDQLAAVVTGQRDQEGGVFARRVVRLVEDRWVPWLPPSEHPAHGPLRRLALEERKLDYDEQAPLLASLIERRERTISVAAYELEEREDGAHVRSVCRWTKDDTLALPRTDRIRFVHGDRTVGEGSWRRVERRFGSLMHPFAPYPERRLVGQFPEGWQLAGL